jgi:hypothetical protein
MLFLTRPGQHSFEAGLIAGRQCPGFLEIVDHGPPLTSLAKLRSPGLSTAKHPWEVAGSHTFPLCSKQKTWPVSTS